MPLFITEEELERCSNNPSLIAKKADSYILQLQREIETVKAQSDASSITFEQTCALLEHKYISLSSDFSKLESQNAQLTSSIELRLKELAEVQSQKHQLHLNAISKDGELERLSTQVTELHKSKRQLLELVEQKDTEISEKNVTIKSYLDKIVNLTEDAASKQAHLRDREAELARSNATCARLLQEKELIERHNVWLNEELTVKLSDTIELRRRHTEAEADMSTKLEDVEKQFTESSRSLKWNKERVKELEVKLTSLQEELCSSKETTGANEARFSAEISTVTKLVELYKESSEEWSRKAGELEGVIKALEMHLSQLESDYKEKLQKEESTRKMHEKEAAELKEKLDKCEAEIENHRKANELSLLPISSFTGEIWTCRSDTADVNENGHLLVPKIPVGVSGTALAVSLLRDGWSLAKMYEKYQEAVDALRHETMGRKQSQEILERVLYEIEEKADVILDERAEHERMVGAYSVINQKLQQSVSEQTKLQDSIQGLKADVRRSEREYDMAQKEIIDLQKQVTVLLKECRDIQLRCGSACNVYAEECAATFSVQMKHVSDTERVISERLLTFRDINELVEQNVQLRSLVRSLSDQIEKRDTEFREMFEVELQKQTDEAACKVEAVLERAEEQGRMIESLHSAVAMYKRLYEEELKLRASYSQYSEAVPETGRKDLMLLEDSQDAYKKANEKAVERAKNLEEELDKSRSDIISLRLERDKLAMETNFAREKLDSFIKEFEHQRDETNGVLARNVEFSQLVVDYQRKVRESSDSLHAAEELSRKLTMEVSLLKHEKELLVNSEKRAFDEVRSLSQRVHQLQASMDTFHSAEEVREEARVMEMRKQEEYLKQAERDWAQVKKELQEERDNVRTLNLDREQTMKNALRQVEDLGKQLADALRSLASAESRAAVAEARYSDLEEKIKSSQDKVVDAGCEPSTSSLSEVTLDLPNVKEEIKKLKEEAQAYKDHMLQYKNIAQVNEVALKQIEFAHEQFKTEADKMKKSLEAEILSLRERFSALESISTSKSNKAAFAIAGKEEALSSALAEIASLKEEHSVKMSEIMGLEVQISSLKEDLEKEHQRWRTAQNNYERQVILQSETIQELTKTSQALALLQEEVSQLHNLADSQKSENDILKEKLKSEKSVLGKLNDDAERKYNEVNEQNKILHARVEALHIKMAEKERLTAGTSGSTGLDVLGDDMQSVVSYLRRSKEIAETEISLLKQEKLRLQSQLESALKASETAQAQLHTERVNSRALLFSDEDFKSLQIQVREMNLLRESNLQLREENKHNFEECQKLREVAQKARVEMEHLQTMVREKEIEVDSCQREIEMQKIEIKNLESRIVELIGACKNVELEEYNQLKDDCQKMQANLRVIEAELDETRKLVSEKQTSIACLEYDLAKTRTELTEKERRIKESFLVEGNLKLDLEKQRKQVVLIKKKFENLTKEKEELSKEKQTLSKQLEDCKRHVGDTSSEHTKKETEVKDARIQILEKHLEKVKEQHKHEKKKRMDNEKAVWDCVKNVNAEKTKLVDELERHKLSRENLLESGGAPIASSTELVLDNLSASYLKAVENFEVAANSYGVEPGARGTPLEASTMNAPSPAGQQVPAQSSNKQLLSGPVVSPSPVVASSPVVTPSQAKTTDERDKRSNLSKPVPESRKGGRVRLVRPRLDPETVEAEKSSITKEKIGVSLDTEAQVDLTLPTQPSARKRSASTSGSELHESLARPDINLDVVPPLSKKSRGSDFPLDSTEGYMSVPPPSLEQPAGLDETFDGAGDHPHTGDVLAIVSEKEELHASIDMEDESKESVSDAVPKGETPYNEIIDASEDLPDKTREIEEGFDEGLMDGVEQDPQQTTVEIDSDREDGELPLDVADEQDGRDISSMMTSIEPVEVQHELAPVPDVQSSAIDEDLGFTVGDLLETTSSDVIMDEKNDKGEGLEETAEDSDKSDNGGDQGVVETDAASIAAGSFSPINPPDLTVSEQDNLTATPVIAEESSPVTRSRILNLAERAEANAAIRQAGIGMVSQTSTRRGKPTAPGPKKFGTRGRGRGRGGRGTTPDKGRG